MVGDAGAEADAWLLDEVVGGDSKASCDGKGERPLDPPWPAPEHVEADVGGEGVEEVDAIGVFCYFMTEPGEEAFAEIYEGGQGEADDEANEPSLLDAGDVLKADEQHQEEGDKGPCGEDSFAVLESDVGHDAGEEVGDDGIEAVAEVFAVGGHRGEAGESPEEEKGPDCAFSPREDEEGGQEDVHFELKGKGPENADDVGALPEVLDEEQIAQNHAGKERVRGVHGFETGDGDEGDGEDGERVDAKDAADVEVEGMGASFERPHQDEAGVDEEEVDAKVAEPAEVPGVEEIDACREGSVVDEDDGHCEGTHEIQIVMGRRSVGHGWMIPEVSGAAG